MRPREILRYPMHWGLVSSEALMPLAAPAAHLFIALCGTVEKLLPQVSRWDVFYRLPHLPSRRERLVSACDSQVSRRDSGGTEILVGNAESHPCLGAPDDRISKYLLPSEHWVNDSPAQSVLI